MYEITANVSRAVVSLKCYAASGEIKNRPVFDGNRTARVFIYMESGWGLEETAFSKLPKKAEAEGHRSKSGYGKISGADGS